MRFALDLDNGSLRALASPSEVIAHCKPVDVRDGFWRFFDDDGAPLEARFDRPQRPDDESPDVGDFSLERALSGLWLQEQFKNATKIQGCGLATIDDLADILKVNRGKRAAQRR